MPHAVKPSSDFHGRESFQMSATKHQNANTRKHIATLTGLTTCGGEVPTAGTDSHCPDVALSFFNRNGEIDYTPLKTK